MGRTMLRNLYLRDKKIIRREKKRREGEGERKREREEEGGRGGDRKKTLLVNKPKRWESFGSGLPAGVPCG